MALPVLLDADVLARPVLADTLLRLAETGAFEPRWSGDIMVALHRRLALLPGLGDQGAARRLRRMDEAYADATVSGYEPLVDAMATPPAHRHLLAAAVQAGCPTLVTFDVQPFRSRAVARHGVTAVAPDDFLLDHLELDQGAVMGALDAQLSALAAPLPLGRFLTLLELAGAPAFATELRRRAGRS